MFNSVYPLFEKGRLLKIEMLELLRDFPRDFLSVYLKDYQDGILSGCEITTQDQLLVINPGIVLFQGILYILKAPYTLSYLSNNRLTVLKANFLDSNKEKDFIRYISQIYLDYNTNLKETEIELCRFKLKEGARLRSNYKDFYDLNTEYDTINRIDASYVSKQKRTLAPEIIYTFAKQALNYKNLQPIDSQFCLLALQHSGFIEGEVLEAYLRLKEQNIEKEMSREQLYLALGHILKGLEQGSKRKTYQKTLEDSIWLD